MGTGVKCSFLTGLPRSLAAAACAWLLIPSFTLAATFEWQQQGTKERIIITMSPSDGIIGNVARIDPTALVLPFTEVPAALLQEKTPAGARLFKNTSVLGNALALHTQTPGFGFVVTERKQDRVVIDIFPDALGARWKPSGTVVPTTELPPPSAVEAAQRAAAEASQNNTAPVTQTAPTATTTPATPQTANPGTAAHPAPVASQSSPPPPASAAPASASTPALSPVAPASAGTPPIAVEAAAPPVPAFLNGNKETSPRSAPLPQPIPGVNEAAQAPAAPSAAGEPPLVVPTMQPTSSFAAPTPPTLEAGGLGIAIAGAAATAPAADPATKIPQAAAVPQVLPQAAPASPAAQAAPASPAAQATQAPAAQPAVNPAPAAAATPQPQAVAAPQPTGQAQAISGGITPPVAPVNKNPYFGMDDAHLPIGSAVLAGPGLSYRARINLKGEDGVEAPAIPTAPAPSSPVQGEPVGGVASTTPAPVTPPAPTPGSPAAPATQAAATPPAASASAAAQPAGQTTATPPASAPAAPQASSGTAPAAQPSAAAPTAVPTGNATAAAEAPIQYVDEQGNPVPPPLAPEVVLPEVREAMLGQNYPDALTKVEALLGQNNLTQAHREEALHLRAEILFAQTQNDFKASYQSITEATLRAMNFNQSSLRNAGALLRLGFMNLKLGNIPEAEARFSMLRKQFPEDENVPLTYYYWGDYYYNKGDISRAADQFQFVLQKYPNSRFAREAALGLARSFYRLGYFKQAYEIVEYIEKRWPRFYLDYPPFLNMMGDVAFRLNHLDTALRYYWLYVNIAPQGEEADVILTRIGDVYSMMRQKRAAEQAYHDSLIRFPDKDGGLIAKMRLAESAITDTPTIAGMFAVFDQPFDVSPLDVYTSILKDHPKSDLVPLAKLKIAMWHLWKKDYIATLDTATEFMEQFPKSELAPKMKEVALKAFATMAAESMVDGRTGRMREIWARYPILQGQEEILSPESRIALASSFEQYGRLNEALETLDPFFLGNKIPTYSEHALNLAISIYLQAEQWAAVRQVADQVAMWELTPQTQTQLDFALAIAAENMGESEIAAPLWEKLHTAAQLPEQQMAYATYFLAKAAEREKKLEKAYLLGQDALTRLNALVESSPNQADLGKVRSQLGSLMDIAETAGRLVEALDYAQRSLAMLEPNDPARLGVEYRMARIFKRQGNEEQWRTMLTNLAKSSPDSVYGKTAARELKEDALRENAAKYSPMGR